MGCFKKPYSTDLGCPGTEALEPPYPFHLQCFRVWVNMFSMKVKYVRKAISMSIEAESLASQLSKFYGSSISGLLRMLILKEARIVGLSQ